MKNQFNLLCKYDFFSLNFSNISRSWYHSGVHILTRFKLKRIWRFLILYFKVWERIQELLAVRVSKGPTVAPLHTLKSPPSPLILSYQVHPNWLHLHTQNLLKLQILLTWKITILVTMHIVSLHICTCGWVMVKKKSENVATLSGWKWIKKKRKAILEIFSSRLPNNRISVHICFQFYSVIPWWWRWW